MLRICKVWDADYPWDVRVEKVARALTSHGHVVHLAARNAGRRVASERLPEAELRRMPPWSWLPGRLDRATMFPMFANPRWLNHIRRVAREATAHVILCRDLPLAPTCIAVGRALGIPVIMDMAENYPAMLQSRHSTGRARPLDLLVRNPTFARWVERWVLKRIDGVLVVVQESAERLTSEGLPDDRVAVVSNTPPLSRLDGARAEHRAGDPLRVVYLGLMEFQRGIGTLLEAAALLKRDGHAARVTLYGDGVDADPLRQRAQELGLTAPEVVFRGRVPNATALAELPSAHVGVVPHWQDESWNTTVPNKLFDYMAAGLAVVTSDAVPCARIVGSTGAGLVYPDRSAEDLAARLRILQDAEARARAGGNGRAAVARTYHWEQDVERMLDLIHRTMERSAAARGWERGRA